MRASVCVGRVGALAVALGVGAGLAVAGGAGAAWASPTDSSASAAGPDSTRDADSVRSSSGQPSAPRVSRPVRVVEKPAAIGPARAGYLSSAEAVPDTAPIRSARAASVARQDVSASGNEDPAPAEAAGTVLAAPAQDLAEQSVVLPTAATSSPAAEMAPTSAPSPAAPALTEPVVQAPSTPIAPTVIDPTSPRSAAATTTVESTVTLLSGTAPVAPVGAAVSAVMLAAARRELDTSAARSLPVVPTVSGPMPDPAAATVDTPGRSAVPAPAAAQPVVAPLAAATAANPIAGFFELIGAFATQIVTAITQFIGQAVLSIVNLFAPSARVVDTITLDEPSWTPGTLVVSPDGKRLYMPLTQYGGVVLINIDPSSPAVNTVTGTIGADNGVWSFADAAITPDGTKLFLFDDNEDSVFVLEATAGSAQGAYSSFVVDSSRAFALSADGTRAYVTQYTNAGSQVAVIDTANYNVIGTAVLVGDPNPDPNYTLPDGFQNRWYFPDLIALSPNGTRAYVVAENSFGPKVAVIDTATLSMVASVGVGIDPTDLAVSPDGKRVYVSNLNSNSVTVIDTATNTVTSTIGTRFPEQIAISPNGKKLFVSNWVSTGSDYSTTSTISVIDTATQLTTATIPVDGGVADLAATDGRLYVTVTGPRGTSIMVVAV